MKKIIIMILVVALFLVGCNKGSKDNNDLNNQDNNANETSAQASDNEQDDEKSKDSDQEEDNKIGQGDQQENTIEFTDYTGREVTLSKNPERVISLYASYAELWYEAGGQLVGVVESSSLPEPAMDLPKTGTGAQPNIEAILALNPDLVILRPSYSGHLETGDVLKQNNIPYIYIDYTSYEEFKGVYKTFCSLNDRKDLYEEQIQVMDETIQDIKTKLAGQEFTYLLMFATSKSLSAKFDTFTADIIDDLGGINIAEDKAVADEDTVQLSLEMVLEQNPDFIFVQTMGSVEAAKERIEKDVASNPAWGSLTAVKEGRYITLPKELFLFKPNMKYGDAYQFMAETISPENFKPQE